MTQVSESKLLVERTGPVTTFTLNRPRVHNALDRDLSAQLNAAVRQVREDRECRVLVLRGAGDTFCAGDDITEFNTWSGDDPYWQLRQYQETVQLIEDLTAVTIAQVDGVCTGGGLELTLVCDFVVATDRSRWGMPEIDWDITPGWGGTSRLGRFAGRRKAKEWNLIGALFSAHTAERYDLINRLTAPENLSREVEALVEVILAKDPLTVRRTKKYLNLSAELHISGGLGFESEATPRQLGQGIVDFTERDARQERRKLSKDFWQD
jgi:enoyl-CoA hydratase/carnithine racemase